jgi:ABC-type Fe3+ transport system substrate-binding protein
LVDCGLLKKHPEWFYARSIPTEISGSPCYDLQGLWIGTCLTSFGICFNRDSLKRLGVQELDPTWETLASPKFINEVALADPTHSTSAAAAYEMIVQQQMQKAVQAGESKEAGWKKGLSILQRMGANTRYFTDSGGLVPLDVSQGEAALGICIDFYGRFLSESIKVTTGRDRMGYFTPAGGSAFTVDPIGILRGAPHASAARLFIEFVLSLKGQKLWDFRAGTAEGPTVYSLRRLPIRKELYAPEFSAFRSDPEVNPYEEVAGFEYRHEWTAPVLHALTFIIRAMCMDSRQELVAAWKALNATKFPPEATARFRDLSTVSYSQVMGPLRTLLQSKNPLEEIRTARMLAEHFRKQYKEAAILAREGK